VSTLTLLKTVFRDAMVYSNGSDVLSGQRETVAKLATNFSRKKLMNLILACENLLDLTLKNGNNAILITKTCYDFRRAIGR
ncbi:hypothetical protein, partial [Eubacterium coprostanoligenes]